MKTKKIKTRTGIKIIKYLDNEFFIISDKTGMAEFISVDDITYIILPSGEAFRIGRRMNKYQIVAQLNQWEIVNLLNWLEYKVSKAKVWEASQQQFWRLFGVCLDDFVDHWLLMFGEYALNIPKFDKFVGTPIGKSTKEWVWQKYGKEAVDLIYNLI